jgi:hypothetical protein
MSRGKVHRFQVLGEIRTAAEVQLEVFVDGKYSAPVDLGTREVTGTLGDKFVLEWPMRGDKSLLQAIGWRITVVSTSENPTTEDLVLHSVSLSTERVAGRPRLGKNRSGI